ncbi:MAG: YaiI/YqxD family protein [Longimicrobiales bacterium]|nr:YaiI/YqxD family protein [Longimicrobiales bacterium]
MTLWIDADATPREVKKIVFRAAARVELRTVLVANQRISTPLNNPHVHSVVVSGGPDVADDYIAEHAAEGDMAVTADIPLAATLVEKGLIVLDPRGERYSEENVRERLSIRDFMASLRDVGVDTGGPSPYGPADKRAFANALDRTLTAIGGGRGAGG